MAEWFTSFSRMKKGAGILRVCNRCHAKRPNGGACELCGCPEFTYEVDDEKENTNKKRTKKSRAKKARKRCK